MKKIPFEYRTILWIIFALFVSFTIPVLAVLADESPDVKVDIKGGRYYLFVGNEQQGNFYTQDHTAKAAAINVSFACQCTVVIKQPDITVTTHVVMLADTQDITISWSRPVKRENGTALESSDIKGYIIKKTFNGLESTIEVGNVLTYTLQQQQKGLYSFSMATIAEQVGAFSEPITRELN